MPTVANRIKNLPPYIFVTIAQQIAVLQAQGNTVLRLDIGNPDMPPPPHVVEALGKSAVLPDNHGYTGYRGIPIFRRAIATHYKNRFGVDIDSEAHVLPLIGSKEGIVNLGLAYLETGDIALVPDVGYPSYAMGARLAGAEVYWMTTNDDGLFDVADIPPEAAERAKIMWINYPNNPTGATASTEFYAQLLAYCREHDILLASDNPYVDVAFDGYRAGSVLEVAGATDCSVEFWSFSKTYNMAGWRLGAAVGNADALKNLLHVKSNMDSGHFKAVYEAGIAAMEHTPQSWIDQRNAIYAARRDRILATLPEIGLDAQKRSASMYVWARVVDGTGDEYVDRALNEANVSLAPGSAYGPGGENYVRISLGVKDAILDEALNRLKQWQRVSA